VGQVAQSVKRLNWLRAGQAGIKSRWGRDFPPVQTGPGDHPASCKIGTGSFPGGGGKVRTGRAADHSPSCICLDFVHYQESPSLSFSITLERPFPPTAFVWKSFSVLLKIALKSMYNIALPCLFYLLLLVIYNTVFHSLYSMIPLRLYL